MPKPALSRLTLSNTVPANILSALLILTAMALPGCKKNRSEPGLQILPDPQAAPRTQAPTATLSPHDTAAIPIRNDPTHNDSTSLEFVSNLYRNYGVNSSFNPLDQGADTLFAPELLALIRQDETRAKGEVGYLDGDPLCDCQDFDITEVGTTLRPSTPSRLIAEVRFLNFERPDTVSLSLIQSNNHWRIEDIRTKSSASLSHDLRTYLSQSQPKPNP
jgi:uncharacterized protein DUF3828